MSLLIMLISYKNKSRMGGGGRGERKERKERKEQSI
jgi:hypothetical protein